MNNLRKILINRNDDNYKDINVVYYIIKELEDYYITKRVDTITQEESFEAISKYFCKDNLYTLEEFFSTATFIGKSGYYIGSTELERFLQSSFVVVYKNETNDLVYDSILNYFFIMPSSYPIESFVPFEEQDETIRFKKGFGKDIF